MNIYVGNLSQQTSEAKLRDLFATYGEVETVKIITDNITNISKGFGFVEMSNKQDGIKAIQELNESAVDSNSIVVNEARPKSAQPGAFKFNNKKY